MLQDTDFVFQQLRFYETRKFLTDNTTVVPYPPRSSNLALGNFLLFPKMKSKAKGQCFGSVEKEQEVSQRVLDKVARNEFRKSFETLQYNWK